MLAYACMIVCCVLLTEANAQRRQPKIGNTPLSLNYRWHRDQNFNKSRLNSLPDRILLSVFDNHVDGFPHCSPIGTPLDVDLQFIVLAMLGVDELSRLVQLSVRYIMTWNHCRLTWNAADFENVSTIEVPRSVSVWVPDVTWMERPDADFEWRTQSRLTLTSTGKLSLVGQAIMTQACQDMNFVMFPFDSHKCPLTFVSLAHDGTNMQLSAAMMTTDDYEKLSHSSQLRKNSVGSKTDESEDDALDTEQWVVRLDTNRVCERNLYHEDWARNDSRGGNSSISYSEATCFIYLRRHPLYHIFSLFTPASIITFLTAFTFLIPPSEADAKIGFALTIMLQLLVFMMYMYERLPVSSTRIPLLTQYFSCCILIVALGVIMSVFIAYVGWLGDDLIAMPRWVKVLGIRVFGRVFVPAHVKVLEKWECHVHLSQSSLRLNVIAKNDASAQPSLEQKHVESTFSTRTIPRAPSLYDNVARRNSGSSRVYELRSQHVQQEEVMMRVPGMSVRQRTVRSVSRAEETVSGSCDNDHDSLVRAQWALVALVLDKICFVLFFFLILACVIYHAMVGSRYWFTFVFD